MHGRQRPTQVESDQPRFLFSERSLIPQDGFGCKRPSMSNEYLSTFNKPHVHLVDTAPMGVTKINERGVVHERLGAIAPPEDGGETS